MIKWAGMIRFVLCLLLAVVIVTLVAVDYATGAIGFGVLALAVAGALGLIMVGVFR